MTYSHIGGDTYEIQLTVFRDCLNGNPGAPFDANASIGIYNKDFELIDSLFIPLMGDDTLSPTLFNECLVVPPSVCVHRTTYRSEIELPPRIGGYRLIYQRCCRNVTINNIVEPLATGATFGVTIKDVALLEKNTSPKFKEWPPVYICSNEPIVFDHSAIDNEGDSIVYRLCNPLDGAIPNQPMPDPWQQTVPMEVVWLAPLYSLDNLLNGLAGGEPLTIDSETGLLTGLPNTVGQFVVGVCMDEYRDGILISSIRRDFQYNVGECGKTTASFFSPLFQCDSLTVNFDNQSVAADSFLWMFNDPGNPGAMSSEVSPTFTFSDTGSYTIMLIANPGGFCEDTFYREIQLLPPSLMPDFSFTYEECSDSLVIQLTDLSTDALSTPVEWLWTITLNGVVMDMDSVQSPTFVIFDPGEILVTLLVTAENGCAKELTVAVPNIIIGDPLVAPDTVVCLGETLMLLDDFDPALLYQWAPGPGITNVNQGQQTVMPLMDQSYQVTITSADGFCRVERRIDIFIPEPIDLLLPPADTICDPTIELSVSSDQAITYIWSTDNELVNVIGNTETIVVEPFGSNYYYVQGIDSFSCTALDSVLLNGQGINIREPIILPICPGDTSILFFISTDPVDVLDYVWSPTDYVINSPTNSFIQISPPGTGVYTYYADIINQFNCTLRDSITLVVLDTTPQLDFLSFQQCGGFEVQFTNTSVNAPFVFWDFGDTTNVNSFSSEENPTYTYPDTGTYQVILTLDVDVPCKDTVFQTIHIGQPVLTPDFEVSYASCGDSVEVVFQDISTTTEGTIVAWDWEFTTGQTASGSDTSLLFYETTILGVILTIYTDEGCEATVERPVVIRLIDNFLADSVQICANESIAINPNGDDKYSYEWSPSIGLDDPFSINPIANPSQTTTYSVTITSLLPDTCQITREITVVVPPPFEFAAPEEEGSCGEDVLLEVTSLEPLTYAWSVDPEFNTINGLGPEFSASPGRPGLYFVQATDTFGCTQSDTISVFDLGIGVVAEDLSMCLGDTQRLPLVNLYPEDILSVVWTPQTDIIADPDSLNPLVMPDATTAYNYQVTNQNNCTDAGTVNVFVLDIDLPLQLSADPTTIIAGETSQLSATTDVSYTYTWTPDPTLSDLDISNPVASPTVTTTYELNIVDDDRCSKSRTITVIVIDPTCEEPELFFPNAFSPNGDGENDELGVLGNYIEEMHLLIYNRWGQKVFESRDQQMTWDGYFNGRLLEPDVFAFYLEVRCVNGLEYRKQVNVMLLR